MFIKYVKLIIKRKKNDSERAVLISANRFYVRVLFTFVLAVTLLVPSVVKLRTIEPSQLYSEGVYVEGVVKHVLSYEPLDIDRDVIYGMAVDDTEVLIYYDSNYKPIAVFTLQYLREEYIRTWFNMVMIVLFTVIALKCLYGRIIKLRSCRLWFNYCRNSNI